MKKIKLTAAIIAAIGILSACQHERMDDPYAGEELVPVTLTASYVETKVSYTEINNDGIKLQPAWEVGDKVIGFDSDKSNYTFDVTAVDENGVATLEGDAPANCKLHLIYLCGTVASSISEGTLSVDYTDQAGDKSMPAVMLADGSVSYGTGLFHFSNAGAVIGINAVKGVPSGSTVSKITISGENLSSASIALDGDVLMLAATEKTGDAISTADDFTATVSDANGTLASKPVLIAVPAGAKISKVSVVVGNDSYSFTLSSPATLVANQYSYVAGQQFVKDVIEFVDLDIINDGGFAITNNGNIPVYIRASVIVNWVDESGNIIKTVENSFVPKDHWTQSASEPYCYYYDSAVPAGEHTKALTASIDAGDPPVPGSHFEVVILAQGRETSWE